MSGGVEDALTISSSLFGAGDIRPLTRMDGVTDGLPKLISGGGDGKGL